MDNYKVDIQAEQFSSIKTVPTLPQKCLGYDTETTFLNDCLVCERLDRHLKGNSSWHVHALYTHVHIMILYTDQSLVHGIQCGYNVNVHAHYTQKCVCRQSTLYTVRVLYMYTYSTYSIHVHAHCTCKHANNLTYSFALNTTCTVPQHMYMYIQ